ncbi:MULTISPECIES: hypothetical protein [Bacillus]|nr:hypothetical protein [Bacillus cereus]MDA2639376.1 hypothetical protein [Bacillus cereus]
MIDVTIHEIRGINGRSYKRFGTYNMTCKLKNAKISFFVVSLATIR